MNNAWFSAQAMHFTEKDQLIVDEFYGEQVAAWIQLHKNETMSAAEIREFCKHDLAHFKIPKYI